MKTIPNEELVRETMKMLQEAKRRQETHERTVQTMKWAGVIVVVLAVAFLFFGCTGVNNPTAPDDMDHPNEELAYNLAQCYANHLDLGEVTVEFSNQLRWVPCGSGTGQGPDGQCSAAGWAWPMNMVNGMKKITLYHPFILDTCYPETCAKPTEPSHINEAVAHEVCHVANNPTEAEAEACEAKVMASAGCF
jgi:hypothetical protein